jgi:hypothetical protein
MTTIPKGELISEARTMAKELGADSNLTNKMLWSIINKHLSWLISRESDKMKLAKYDYLYQTIKCVHVEEAPAIDPCCGIRSKCTVWRTTDKLPELFEDMTGVIIKSVFSIDGSSEFVQINIQDYMRKLEDPNSKYDNNKYFFFNNGYLYFPKKSVKMVMVKGHFKSTVVSCCEGEEVPCVSKLEENAMMPAKLRGELMEYVKKDLLPYKQLPMDTQIDKNDNKKGEA